jgi:hypothetical protein
MSCTGCLPAGAITHLKNYFMITSKREEDAKREEQENIKTAFVNGQSPESVKKNPNPRANENLPEKDKENRNDEDATGAGSEVTDGEDG